MTTTKQLSLVGAVLLLIGCVFFLSQTAKANPSSILENRSASATSTTSFLQPGLATTTNVFDMQADNAPADSASLMIQLVSSSSVTQLKWRYEFAQGQPGVNCAVSQGLCDWYSESLNNAASTASSSVEVRDFKEYSWMFASSTQGASAGPKDTAFKLVTVPTPTRYVRVLFYLPIGSGNGAVWSNFAAKRENR